MPVTDQLRTYLHESVMPIHRQGKGRNPRFQNEAGDCRNPEAGRLYPQLPYGRGKGLSVLAYTEIRSKTGKR